MKEVADGIVYLKKIREEVGEKGIVDYIIALPPVQERHLIDYMTADDYKLYRDLRDDAFSAWICNPQEKSLWCCQGAPKDKLFSEYLKVRLGSDLMGMFANMPYRIEANELRKQLMEE